MSRMRDVRYVTNNIVNIQNHVFNYRIINKPHQKKQASRTVLTLLALILSLNCKKRDRPDTKYSWVNVSKTDDTNLAHGSV